MPLSQSILSSIFLLSTFYSVTQQTGNKLLRVPSSQSSTYNSPTSCGGQCISSKANDGNGFPSFGQQSCSNT